MEKLTIKKMAYQATAFERFGLINMQKFKANEILEVIDLLSDDEIIKMYNNYLIEINSDEYYYLNDDDFLNEFFSEPASAVKSAIRGDYSYNDDYVKFNGYNNLESLNSYELKEIALNDEGFLNWLYVNYNGIDDLGGIYRIYQ